LEEHVERLLGDHLAGGLREDRGKVIFLPLEVLARRLKELPVVRPRLRRDGSARADAWPISIGVANRANDGVPGDLAGARHGRGPYAVAGPTAERVAADRQGGTASGSRGLRQ